MKKVSTSIGLLLFCLIMVMCTKEDTPDDPPINEEEPYTPPAGTTQIPVSGQRDNGDAVTGYEYLTTGDYLSSGVPYAAYLAAFGETTENYLGRDGDNAVVSHDYTAVNAPNGVRVVAPNCMQCHASKLNGEFIVGLGNSASDFTFDAGGAVPLVDLVIQNMFGLGSPEWEAYEPFAKAAETTGPNLVTEMRGPNPADMIAAVLAAHRDKYSLEWSDEPLYENLPDLVPTDVPPWWVLKKKNAMFYNGMGRGDFSRYLMASSLLTMKDSTKANEVDAKFPDILAYLYSIEAPTYPETIDQNLADQGKLIFEQSCSGCHGTYGPEEFYPNLLVDTDVVGTDAKLSDSYESAEFQDFKDWFNTGWFSKDPNSAELVAEGGYVAQPLDGIWASAPYLHNGSIPTLEDLLNSEQRPTYWKRTFEDDDYNFEKVGWNYSTESSQVDTDTYDTTIYGYGNGGHTFGDHLSDSDRGALIEYLKTL